MMLAFLLLSSMMIWDNLTLRIITNGVVLVLAWLLFYASGVSKGAVAVNSGEILYQRQQEGKALDNADVRASFHPLKGFVTGIIGDLPCLVVRDRAGADCAAADVQRSIAAFLAGKLYPAQRDWRRVSLLFSLARHEP